MERLRTFKKSIGDKVIHDVALYDFDDEHYILKGESNGMKIESKKKKIKVDALAEKYDNRGHRVRFANMLVHGVYR